MRVFQLHNYTKILILLEFCCIPIFSVGKSLPAFPTKNVAEVSKTNVAVIELEGIGISRLEASMLTDRLRASLVQTEKVNVMERGQMEAVLQEQGFQQTGCVDTECAVQLGRILGCEQIIIGSISKVGDVFSIIARVIDAGTGEILKVTMYTYEGNIGGLLKSGMKNVAIQLTTG